jgi:hypothetical protein
MATSWAAIDRLGRLAVAMVCGLLLVAGCSGPAGPQIAPAQGTVTWRGAPVAGAQVTFMPQGGRLATGTTDDQGKFKLSTLGQADGALVGNHAVTVTKRVPLSNEPYAPERSEIPPQYAVATTSPLKAEVTAAGPNDFSFELVGEAK